MIIGAEIGLLIYGIIALIRQKFKVGKQGEVTGWRAVVLGLVCMAVLPCAIVVGLIVGIILAIQKIEANFLAFIWIDIAAIVIALATVAILGRKFLAQQLAQTSIAPPAIPAGSTSFPPAQPFTYDPSNPYAPSQRS